MLHKNTMPRMIQQSACTLLSMAVTIRSTMLTSEVVITLLLLINVSETYWYSKYIHNWGTSNSNEQSVTQ